MNVWIRISVLALFSFTNCTPSINPELLKPAVTPKISEECLWRVKRETFEWNEQLNVIFNHKICLDDGGEIIVAGKPRGLKTNGTKFNSLYVDVISDSFSVLKYDGEDIERFLSSLIKKDVRHENVCKPKKLSDSIWIIEDGLSANETITFMPCGSFGRNFAGQTLFKITEHAILHHNIPHENDDIDKSSISFELVP